MKTALVYDWVNKWGGAERVLLTLHRIFPKAPLFTAVYNKERAKWASVFDVRTSFLQRYPFARANHEFFFPLLPLAFESFSFDEYDLVISLTSAFAKGIITKPNTYHLCYCLTPTRYLWQSYEDYSLFGLANPLWFKIASRMKIWDKIAATRPDSYLAISKTVAKRLKKYYQVDSEVIYPPVKTQTAETLSSGRKRNFFLVVSRLVSYKKIEIAIEAFNQLKLDLVVVGTGREEKKLRRMANSNISFLKDLTESEVSWYYRHCQALIVPQEEDFGLASVEAQLHGSPVIAFKSGGSLETVIEGKTGSFFYPQNSQSLIQAIKKFQKQNFLAVDCLQNSKFFDENKFIRRFKKTIMNLNIKQ